MKHFAFILWSASMLIPYLTNAQSGPEKSKSYLIKYDLISLLGDQVTNSMGIQIGSEIFLTANGSLEADVMIIFPCSSCGKPYTSIKTEKTNGFTLSAAYRYYFYSGVKPSSGFHIGPQALYQYTVSELSETYDDGIPNSYHVYRNMGCLHAMTGYQICIAGPLYFDPVIGLGLRYISSYNRGKKGEGSGQFEFPYNKDFETGSKLFPSVTINLKIGFKL